jgi:Fe-S cluster biosynthesis and repair protein YggX
MDDPRIEQFKKMAEADPDNELGHFSLGKAYVDAGRPAEAIPCLERVVTLNPGYTKAYHLLAMARKSAGDRQGAIGTLARGIAVADERGDRMPRRDMAAMLTELGETPPPAPDETGSAAPAAAGEGQVHCRRCGRTAPALPERPFKGALGEQVLASVCADCWREWIPTGTKVINELRLDFANPQHAQTYDQHMREFLGLQ